MNVVVFSGTTEGRSFSRALAALGAAVTVCVATELGAEEQGRALPRGFRIYLSDQIGDQLRVAHIFDSLHTPVTFAAN